MPGKAVVHIHSQAALPRVPEAWAELDVPVHLVDKPVEGDLRFGWSFVEAMTTLWDNGLQRTTSADGTSGCKPQWHQLLSDSCAPLRTCAEVHSGLAQRPGVSHFEAQQCGLDDAECYNRWPTGWPSGDMSKDPASCTKIRDMEKGCAAWLHTVSTGYGAEGVAKACGADGAGGSCAMRCCIHQNFNPDVAKMLKPEEEAPVSATLPFWKASQWATIWWEHASFIVAASKSDAQRQVWSQAAVPDEHFAVNQLVANHAPFANHGLTHVIGYTWEQGFAELGAHAISVDCDATAMATAASDAPRLV
jgi:hypothetical protein